MMLNGAMLDVVAKIVGILGFLGVIAAFWRLRLVNRQLEDLLEAKKAKVLRLKRAVAKIYDSLQDVSAPPDWDRQEILGFSAARLSLLESSSDAFAFREIRMIAGLPDCLEKLDEAVQDARDDLESLKVAGVNATDQDLEDAAKHLDDVYKLAGECDSKLKSFK